MEERVPETVDGPGEESLDEQVQAAIAAAAVGLRRVTMVFDPSMAADAARAVRGGGTLAAFVEAMHEDGEGIVDPTDALAVDGYDYTASPSARQAEEEIAAWRDLLHGPPP